MLSFTTAHVAVIALRYKEPDRLRPYRVPWNVPFRGRSLPLAAVVGALGTFAAWVSVVVLHDEARTVGVGWMAVGLVAYLAYRRKIGLDPRKVARIERKEAPAGFRELAYGSALVPVFGSDVSGDALRRAATLAGEDATVDAVYVIEVPSQLSLDAGLEEEEARARQVLDTARIRARDRRVKIRTSVLRTRSAGPALVEEARARGSEIVYLDVDHAPAREDAFGPTATYLLGKRPCRVIVETSGGNKNGRPEGARSREGQGTAQAYTGRGLS
jgi:APA family basic amino acid/polyamine antiporter